LGRGIDDEVATADGFVADGELKESRRCRTAAATTAKPKNLLGFAVVDRWTSPILRT